MKKLLLLSILIAVSFPLLSQNLTVKKAAFHDKTPALRDMQKIEPGIRDRSWKDNVIRNEADPRFENLDRNKNTLPEGPDPVWQKSMGRSPANTPIQNFEGTSNVNGVYPPDTDGDVGPDHYYQMINLSFQIFDKEGNSLYGPADNSTIWDGFIGPWTGTNDGDPITIYDKEADRWLVSQFAINTSDGSYWELIAVSATGDPLGEYYRYAFEFPAFNDYPKLGIWPDAYYASFNMFGSYNRVSAAAFERDAILEGDPDARMVLFDLEEGSEPWSMLPADFDGEMPPEGTPNYFAFVQDDWFADQDQVKIWEFEVDWDNVENSTFEEAHVIDVSDFDSEICPAYRGRCIHQPLDAPLLESLAGRLMFRLQYRNFGDYEAIVTYHTVDADGTGLAGIRWYEFRDYDDGQGWQLHQEGTYAPDSDHRWMGSVAMNAEGYIALGYSVSSTETYPSIRYTGRGPNAPLGEMVFTEETIIDGSGVQTGQASRWGDYSRMAIDPTDDETFWFTTEYMEQSGQVGWQTRIASFQLEEDFIAPEAVSDLSAETPTTNGVWLKWTSTPDNLGTPYLYDVRYSTEPITTENFEDATQAQDTPEPSPAGTEEAFYISGLNFNETYYFALKVVDRQYNYSELSNVAQAQTPGPPELVANQQPRIAEAYQGFSVNDSLIFDNPGDSDIRFELTKGDTVPGSPGEIIQTFPNAGTGLLGMHFEQDKIFLVNSGIHALMIYDTSAQVLADTVPIHEQPFGITSDGEKLWIGNKNGLIKAYDFEGNPTGDSLSFPMINYHAMAYNGEHLLLNAVNDDDPVIYKINPETGENEGSVHTEIDMDIWQSTWVDEHQDGKLWITNNDGLIAQLIMDEATGKYTVLQQFDAPASISYALSHTGDHLLYAEVANQIYLVDDGVDEINWLSYPVLADTIASGDEYELVLDYDASSLEPNTYPAYMKVHSNDPEQPEITIPIEFTVLSYDAMEINITGLPGQVCQGNPLSLSAEVQGGAGPFTYHWFNGQGEMLGQEPEINYLPMEETTLYLEVKDDAATVTDSVVIAPDPSPQFALGADTTICMNHTLQFEIPEGYVSYEWHDGSTSNTFVADSTNTGIGENIITATAEGENGCKTTDTVKVYMETCAGIAENAKEQIRIFPNPASDKIFVAMNFEKGATVQVMDINGNQVFSDKIAPTNARELYSIDISEWETGTYFFTADIEGRKFVRKFIVKN